MMRYIVLSLFMTFSYMAFSQIKAVTEDGKDVLLNEDGTWNWDNNVKGAKDNAVSEVLGDVANGQSDRRENYFVVSKRLDRYFTNPKNQIRSSSVCEIQDGIAKIKFLWEVYLPDGNRYFGFMKDGLRVTLNTIKDEKIELTLNEDVNVEMKEKYNVTLFSGTSSLSNEQLEKICNTSIKSVEVFWKKNSEVYDMKNPDDFKESFYSILKK